MLLQHLPFTNSSNARFRVIHGTHAADLAKVVAAHIFFFVWFFDLLDAKTA